MGNAQVKRIAYLLLFLAALLFLHSDSGNGQEPMSAKPSLDFDPNRSNPLLPKTPLEDEGPVQKNGRGDPVLNPDGTVRHLPLPPKPIVYKPLPVPDEKTAYQAIVRLNGGAKFDPSGRIFCIHCMKTNVDDLNTIASLKNLTEVVFQGPNIKDADLGPLAKASKLKLLYFLDSSISDDALKVVGQLISLEKLALISPHVTSSGMPHLKRLQNLQDLYLRDSGVGDDGMRFVAKLKSLRYLHLSPDVGEKGLRQLETLTQLATLKRRGSVTDAELEAIGHIPNLTTIDMQWFEVTDEGLKGLVPLKKLRSLDLSNSNVTDAGMVYIAKLAGLKKFVIYGHIGDIGLDHLTDSQSISWLCVSDANTTDAGLAHIDRMGNLDRVCLAGTEVGDMTAMRLAKLQKLRCIDLSDTRVTKTGFLALRGLKNLKQVNLTGTKFSDKEFSELYDELPVSGGRSGPPTDPSGPWRDK
jgi:uncharacterized protein YjbI with pentapeptide repeats